MAIQDPNTPQGGQTSMGAAMSNAGVRGSNGNQGGANSAGQGAQQQPQRQPFSFRALGGLVPTPMGRTPASEVLTKLTKALQTQYESADSRFEIKLLPLDLNSNNALSVSVLTVAVRNLAKKHVGVAYHTLILEGSVEQPASRTENIAGTQVEILVTMGDADNDRLAGVVVDAVARQFDQSKLWNAASEVVPRDFNVADEATVYALAANAVYACCTELDLRDPDFVDLNLANASREDTLTVRVAFPKNQIVNAVGQPVRNDISLDLQAGPAGQPNQQQMERIATISRIGGFLDLVWSPAVQVQQPWNPYPQAPGAAQQQLLNQYQKYAVRYVMTHMESVAAPTLACQLLTLAMASALRENSQYVGAFRPQPFSSSDVDLHDIGAIGIEVNFEGNPGGYGQRIDTKSDSFKADASLAKLIGATIQPGLILSLDVEECGPSTWMNGVFAAAAEGNGKANDLVIRAANHLTDGAFARHFQGNSRVAIDENNRIHMGWYIDRNGIKRDLRDIDYLAVLNMVGEKDPEVVRDWSDTFVGGRFPLAQRLAARRRIMQGLFGDSLVITGFARRVTFENAFIDSLVAACLECGLDVKSVAPYTDVAYERASATFTQHTLLSNQASGLFNRGYGSFQNAAAGGNRQFGGGARWF